MTPAAIALIVVLILAANLLVARVALRMFFYPRPRAFPPAATDLTIDQLLARLDRVLEEHARGVAVALRPGLSDDQINALEWKHHCALSEDVRALYRWHDGMPRGEKIPALIPGHRFVPLAEAMELRDRTNRDVRTLPLTSRLAHAIFAGHRTDWLQVLDDGCGDGYFYDPARRGRDGAFFYLFAEDRHYRYFRTVADFLAGVIECYQHGVYRTGAAGETGEDFDQSTSLWLRFAQVM